MTVIISAILIGVVCFFLYIKRKLTKSGAVAAYLVGVATVVGVGAAGLLLYAVFFGSSIMMGKLHRSTVDADVVDKSGARDANQVLANGGVAALCSLFVFVFPDYSLLGIVGFVGSIAAATADTWASELGKFSKEKPVHIITGERVPQGVSGAVSGLGTAAAIAGSFVIAVTAILIWWSLTSLSHVWLLFFTIIGFVANLVDTLVGALYQTLYKCPECGAITEKRYHCTETIQTKGISFVTNDLVNLTCTGAGAVLSIVVVIMIM